MNKLTTTFSKLNKLCGGPKNRFWTISHGKTIGFIESMYVEGMVFPCDFINFRETSSNLSSGEIKQISIGTLSREQKYLLEKNMKNRNFICVNTALHLLGSPNIGKMTFPIYLNDFTILGDEVICVKADEPVQPFYASKERTSYSPV
jgi:hypothetical protein